MAFRYFQQFERRTSNDVLSQNHLKQERPGVYSSQSRIIDRQRADRETLIRQSERLCAAEKARNDAVLQRVGLLQGKDIWKGPVSFSQSSINHLPQPPGTPRQKPAVTPRAPVPPPTPVSPKNRETCRGTTPLPPKTVNGGRKTQGMAGQGLSMYQEVEKEWRRKHQQRMKILKDYEEKTRMAEERWRQMPNGMYTTAEKRPDAYIHQEARLPLPRPYGAQAPFKPTQLGPTMRHFRRPMLRPLIQSNSFPSFGRTIQTH